MGDVTSQPADVFPVCSTPFRVEDFERSFTARAVAAVSLIRFPAGQQIAVLPHVRAFALAAQEATGVSSWGTYIGHQPTPGRALDAFASKGDGDELCEWAFANWSRFGCRYVMWQHRINYNDGNGWQWVEDRGSDTDNHMDHAHFGFEASAPDAPNDEESFMALTDEEQRELLVKVRSIDDNTNDIGGIVFSLLGDGNWEEGAARLVRAVETIERLGAGTGNVDTGGGTFTVTGTLELSQE